MSDENKFWLSLWLGLAFFVCLLVAVSFIGYNSLQLNMAKQGYEKVTIPGSGRPVWHRVRDK